MLFGSFQQPSVLRNSSSVTVEVNNHVDGWSPSRTNGIRFSTDDNSPSHSPTVLRERQKDLVSKYADVSMVESDSRQLPSTSTECIHSSLNLTVPVRRFHIA